MNTPDETQPDQTMPNAPTEVLPPAAAETPPAAAEAPPAIAAEVPAAEAPAPAPAKARTPRPPPKPRVSDETLAEYQAAIAADQAARQRQQRGAVAARERAEAFRALRAALRRLDEQPAAAAPETDPIRDDALAVAVHEAPERIRTILAATLKALSKASRRR